MAVILGTDPAGRIHRPIQLGLQQSRIACLDFDWNHFRVVFGTVADDRFVFAGPDRLGEIPVFRITQVFDRDGSAIGSKIRVGRSLQTVKSDFAWNRNSLPVGNVSNHGSE